MPTHRPLLPPSSCLLRKCQDVCQDASLCRTRQAANASVVGRSAALSRRNASTATTACTSSAGEPCCPSRQSPGPQGYPLFVITRHCAPCEAVSAHARSGLRLRSTLMNSQSMMADLRTHWDPADGAEPSPAARHWTRAETTAAMRASRTRCAGRLPLAAMCCMCRQSHGGRLSSPADGSQIVNPVWCCDCVLYLCLMKFSPICGMPVKVTDPRTRFVQINTCH